MFNVTAEVALSVAFQEQGVEVVEEAHTGSVRRMPKVVAAVSAACLPLGCWSGCCRTTIAQTGHFFSVDGGVGDAAIALGDCCAGTPLGCFWWWQRLPLRYHRRCDRTRANQVGFEGVAASATVVARRRFQVLASWPEPVPFCDTGLGTRRRQPAPVRSSAKWVRVKLPALPPVLPMAAFMVLGSAVMLAPRLAGWPGCQRIYRG